MPHDPYAILHALLRAEAARTDKTRAREQREEPRADRPHPKPTSTERHNQGA